MLNKIKAVDPEKQKLKDDLNICLSNERKNNMIIVIKGRSFSSS
jgi:hypothetical protein